MSQRDHTFTFPADLSRFPKETQRVLNMAKEVNWTVRWLGSQHVMACIISPDGSHSINIPSTNINHNRMKSWLNQINRHSDPDLMADYIDKQTLVPKKSPGQRIALPGPVTQREIADTATAQAMAEAKRLKRTTANIGNEVRSGVGCESCSMAYDKCTQRIFHTPNGACCARCEATDTHDVEVVSLVSDTVVAAEGEPSRTLVTTKPWMVRKGGKHGSNGTMYESPVTLERVWSDGSIDYRCKHCEYTADNGRSVSAHASKKHKDTVGLSRQADVRRVTNYQATDIKHPMSAVRRMKSELLHALDSIHDWQSMDPEALTQRLAETLYEMRPDREPVAELTPEQVISRIVGLVDRGRLADMHQKVEHTAEALAVATGQVQAYALELERERQEVTRLREERKALRDLLADSEVSS